MRQRAIVVGGGVAGLTAAHELVERDFEVHVYERRPVLGGKAASVRFAPADAQARHLGDLPGEHGFRFFPGWYRHLPDTLGRIPFRRRRGTGRGRNGSPSDTVLNHLATSERTVLAWFDRPPISVPLRLPTLSEASAVNAFVNSLTDMGLTAAEVRSFITKLVEFAAMPEERRLEQLEGITWWAYLECHSKSRAYCDLVRATTRTMVAAKAEDVSAYTIGHLALRTISDLRTTMDRVLDGPTSEVWIEPWIDMLEAKGVVFHLGQELSAIQFHSDRREVATVSFEPVAMANVRRLRRLVTSLRTALPQLWEMRDLSQEGGAGVDPECTRLANELSEVAGSAASLTEELRAQVADPDHDGDGTGPLEQLAALLRTSPVEEATKPHGRSPARTLTAINEKAIQSRVGALFTAVAVHERSEIANILVAAESALSDVEAAVVESEGASGRGGTEPGQAQAGDYFVFALPLEQMAYLVNRSPTLRLLAPELAPLPQLALSMDWMTGIQFYLRLPFSAAPGHIVTLDSEWALTAIEQTQFWPDIDVPEGVAGVISVDISAWDRRGRFVRKEAFNCSDDEIAHEVWSQLKAVFGRGNQPNELRDEMLWQGTTLRKDVNYHLDTSLIDQRDRKKQAAYEKARGLHFKMTAETAGSEDDPKSAAYMWGPQMRFNAEPLLINRIGTHALRPTARTSIRNLVLAADYVKTDTDLACMEGANEAARRAVNAVLDAAASPYDRCELFKFSVTNQIVDAILSAPVAGLWSAGIDRARAAGGRIVSQLFSGLGKEIVTRREQRLANQTSVWPDGSRRED